MAAIYQFRSRSDACADMRSCDLPEVDAPATGDKHNRILFNLYCCYLPIRQYKQYISRDSYVTEDSKKCKVKYTSSSFTFIYPANVCALLLTDLIIYKNAHACMQ